MEQLCICLDYSGMPWCTQLAGKNYWGSVFQVAFDQPWWFIGTFDVAIYLGYLDMYLKRDLENVCGHLVYVTAPLQLTSHLSGHYSHYKYLCIYLFNSLLTHQCSIKNCFYPTHLIVSHTVSPFLSFQCLLHPHQKLWKSYHPEHVKDMPSTDQSYSVLFLFLQEDTGYPIWIWEHMRIIIPTHFLSCIVS